MDGYLHKVGFQWSESDDTLYVRLQGKNLVILVMCVDDLIIIMGNNDDHIVLVKKDLQARFKMTDLGLLHYYLGVEVFQHSNNIFISQCKYAFELLKIFCMVDCKSILTPMERKLKLSKLEGGELVSNTSYRYLIGSLIYLATTLLELSYVVNILSRFMQEHRESHWNATTWVLRYIQGTKYYGLLYK